jgi:hypothetical protein
MEELAALLGVENPPTRGGSMFLPATNLAAFFHSWQGKNKAETY